MKQLTQPEFDALLNETLLDVRVHGAPPNSSRVLLWYESEWVIAKVTNFPEEKEIMWTFDKGGIWVDTHPIYHKLPDDYLYPSIKVGC